MADAEGVSRATREKRERKKTEAYAPPVEHKTLEIKRVSSSRLVPYAVSGSCRLGAASCHLIRNKPCLVPSLFLGARARARSSRTSLQVRRS